MPLNALDGTPRPRDSHAQNSAAKFFSHMAASSWDSGTAVDVLAVGCLAVNAPMLSRVCDMTGGAFMIHEGGFGLLPRVFRIWELMQVLVLGFCVNCCWGASRCAWL